MKPVKKDKKITNFAEIKINIRTMLQLDFKTVKTFKNGGIFKEYIFIDKNQSDYLIVKNIGIEFARLGKSVEATPVLHFKSYEYAIIYSSLQGTKYYRKCPDLCIDGQFYEVETYIPPFSKNKVSNMQKKVYYNPRKLLLTILKEHLIDI